MANPSFEESVSFFEQYNEDTFGPERLEVDRQEWENVLYQEIDNNHYE